MADMQAGVGPFLGVFLPAHGWQSGWIGSVMTMGAVAGMFMTVPAGAWVDASSRKRGLVAAHLTGSWGVFPVQMLDGVGAGLQSVAVPGLVARILNGTGRIKVGQGAVMTAQGMGTALSPVLCGWIAQWSGYGVGFLILGLLAVGSLVIWTICRTDIQATSLHLVMP